MYRKIVFIICSIILTACVSIKNESIRPIGVETNKMAWQEMLIGREWVTDVALPVGQTKIRGFNLNPNEGVSFVGFTKDGARFFPSSFSYAFSGNRMTIEITFSADRVKIGEKFYIDLDKLPNGRLKLTHAGKSAVFRAEENK